MDEAASNQRPRVMGSQLRSIKRFAAWLKDNHFAIVPVAYLEQDQLELDCTKQAIDLYSEGSEGEYR